MRGRPLEVVPGGWMAIRNQPLKSESNRHRKEEEIGAVDPGENAAKSARPCPRTPRAKDENGTERGAHEKRGGEPRKNDLLDLVVGRKTNNPDLPEEKASERQAHDRAQSRQPAGHLQVIRHPSQVPVEW